MMLRYKQSLSLALAFLVTASSFGSDTKPALTNPAAVHLKEQLDKFTLRESIRYTVFKYDLVRTPSEFSKAFLGQFSKADQQFYLKTTRGMSVLPKASIEENAIVFRDKEFENRVEFIPGNTSQFKVNGYLWSYDPSLPLVTQVEVLLRYHGPKKISAHLLELLMPKAHAQLVLGGAIVTTLVVGIFGAGGVDVFNKLTSQAICAPTRGKKGPNSFQPRNVGFCQAWDTEFDKRQQKRAPRLDAIERTIASDNSNIFTKFKVLKTFSCPSNNDGNNRVYDANVKLLKPDKNVDEKEIQLLVTLTPQGKTMALSVFGIPEGCRTGDETKQSQSANVSAINCEDRQKVNKLIGTIDFDGENFMKCLTKKTPSKERDALTPDETKLCPESANLNPKEQGQLALSQDLTLFANSVITKCNVDANVQKVADGKVDQIGSPVAPKANDVALPPKEEPQKPKVAPQNGRR
jgi:hypothetical protein